MTQQQRIGLSQIIQSAGSFPLKCIKLADYIVGSIIAFLCPSLKSSHERHAVPKKLLIIRPGGIGDAVFLLPILKQLQHQGVDVDVLCEKRNAAVFQSQSALLNNIFIYHDVRDLINVMKVPYDAVVDTEQWHYLSALVSYFSKAPIKVGFATRLRRAKLFHYAIQYKVGEYELSNFNRLFEALGITSLPYSIKGSFNIEDNTQPIPSNAVGFFWGGSIVERRLDDVSVHHVVKHLIDQSKHVVLLGGPETAHEAEQVASQWGKRVTNYVGKLSLHESVAALAQCKHFIGTDSGLLHLAVAAGVPSTGIFGPGNAQKWGQEVNVIDCKNHPNDHTTFGYTFLASAGKKLHLDQLIMVE